MRFVVLVNKADTGLEPQVMPHMLTPDFRSQKYSFLWEQSRHESSSPKSIGQFLWVPCRMSPLVAMKEDHRQFKSS